VAAGLGVVVWITWRAARDARGVSLLLPATAHLLALAAFVTEIGSRGLRVWLLARALGEPLRLGTSVRAQLAADAGGAVTPSRSGSDPAKVTVLRQDGLRWGGIGALLVGEITVEALVLLPVAVLLVILVPSVPQAAWGGFGYAFTVVVLGSAALLLARFAPDEPPALLRALGVRGPRWGSCRSLARDFLSRCRALLGLSALQMLGLVATTLLHQGARLAILPALASVVAPGAPLGPLVAWPFLLLWAGALLPPPGGGGVVEAGFALALDRTLPEAVLPATLLWWRFYSFYLAALLGGLILLTLRARTRPRTVGEGGEEARTPALADRSASRDSVDGMPEAPEVAP
jgi:hypothetical protein